MKEDLFRLTKSLIWHPLYLFQNWKRLNGKEGSFLMTTDIETANDFVHWMDKESAIKKAYLNRLAIDKLINFSENINLPITWFCTGHSLLENCSGHKPRRYPWALPKNGFVDGYNDDDWFKFDPCENYHSKPEWYFGDLFKKISKSKVKHEIGSHTFSHLRADLCTEKDFFEDMNELGTVFSKEGIEMLSHAFPWNKSGNIKILRKLGIKICRLKKGYFPSSIETTRVSSPYFVYESFEGRLASFEVMKFGIDLASKTGTCFVLLVHPEEISSNKDFAIFRRITEYAKTLESQKKITINTLREKIL